MMAQGWAESTCEITNYGKFINQFPTKIDTAISKGLTKKYVDKNVFYVQSNMYQWRNATKICIYTYMYYITW